MYLYIHIFFNYIYHNSVFIWKGTTRFLNHVFLCVFFVPLLKRCFVSLEKISFLNLEEVIREEIAQWHAVSIQTKVPEWAAAASNGERRPDRFDDHLRHDECLLTRYPGNPGDPVN